MARRKRVPQPLDFTRAVPRPKSRIHVPLASRAGRCSDARASSEGGTVSGLDFLSPQARAELENFIEQKVEAILHRRRPETRWVSVWEAAGRLGISERALRGRIERGRVPVKHQGRSVLVDLTALDRMLEDGS